MMLPYATTAQLAEWMGVTESDLPEEATRLILRASELVQSVSRNNYDETNFDHVEAVQHATCAQVDYWITGPGEQREYGGNVESEQIGKFSVNYGKGQSEPRIAPRTRDYLLTAGLLYAGVSLR